VGVSSSRWLVAFRPRHPYRCRTRWLTEHGAFSCDRSQAVAVHKDCLAHPALAELLGVLRANLRGLARQHGDIRVVS
jgi:hypothetical protein